MWQATDLAWHCRYAPYWPAAWIASNEDRLNTLRNTLISYLEVYNPQHDIATTEQDIFVTIVSPSSGAYSFAENAHQHWLSNAIHTYRKISYTFKNSLSRYFKGINTIEEYSQQEQLQAWVASGLWNPHYTVQPNGNALWIGNCLSS
jgi:hypothetical protein